MLPSDTVVLRHEPASGQLLFDHYLAQRQTLYGAARFYGHQLDDVYRLNPDLRAGYTPGTRVTVTIPRDVIRPDHSPDSIAWFVPVHYRIGEGETLYGLSRRTLGLPSDSLLLALNPGLSASTMSPGRVIQIGYLRIDGIDPEQQGTVEDPYVIRNYGLRTKWDQVMADKVLRTTNGKAAWTAKGDRTKFMALHRSAPIGSMIEIEDPRSRKILYATVVGRIPEQVYDSRVILVVSPLLVKAFGVRDREFYVRTRHR